MLMDCIRQQATKIVNSKKSFTEQYQKLKDVSSKRKFIIYMVTYYLKNPQNLIKFINENHESEQMLPIIMQVIWSIHLMLSPADEDMKHLANLVSEISLKGIIERNILLTQLPDVLIGMSGLIQKGILEKKTQRAYTKINYEQHKYSLLRENNEGYAKLSMLLLNLKDNLDESEVWDKIVSLVGNFDLDPDRVLDLIVEARIQNNKIGIYMNLIIKFKKQSILYLLGNKIKNCVTIQQTQKIIFTGTIENFINCNLLQLWNENGFLPNPYLITIIAQLLKIGCFTIDDIIIYFYPTDKFLYDINIKRLSYGKNKIDKAFTMKLQEMDNEEKQKLINQDNLIFMGQLIYSSKMMLLTELIKINSWSIFYQIWSTYQSYFDLLLYQPLLHNLLDLLSWIVSTLYAKISYSKFFKAANVQQFQFQKGSMYPYQTICSQFFTSMRNIFKVIGIYIGFKPLIYIKICRLFKALIKTPQLFVIECSPEQIEQNIKYILKEYLVPGSCCQTSNPTHALQVFQVLQLYDYRFRYQCHLHVYSNFMTLNPYLAKVFEHVKLKQHIILNNLSKDNKKVFLKKMAKITHNQALAVLYWVVRRLLMKDYQAVVPEIINVLSNCTSMTLQIAIFLMIYSLNEQKLPSVNCKTREFEPWFKNIITFISLFFRKYLQVDMQPVFDYIISKISQPVRQIQDNNEMPGALLKLLHELLNKMFGSVMIQDIDRSKLQIISAGPRLQFEKLYLSSQIRAAKKSKIMLQRFFWNRNVSHSGGYSLTFNLLILLAQKRSQVLHKSYIEDLKIVGDIYDQFSLVIMQLIRFLKYQSADYIQYGLLLPPQPLNVLLNQYQLPLEIAFEIIRPSINQISQMTPQEWQGTLQMVDTSIDNYLSNPKYLIKGYRNQSKLDNYLNQYKSRFKELLPNSFFTTFWLLSLDQIYFPQKLYTEKIEELRKKIEQSMIIKRGSYQRPDRQGEKAKALFQKLVKESQLQKKKMSQTMKQKMIRKMEIDFLKSTDKSQAQLTQKFAQIFVQVCLLPRMLLDASQALYCIKFTVEIIKRNKMSWSKSIRLLMYIIEHIMNYLPYSTHRQASNCLSIFLSEILSIFINWNDWTKLRQDMNSILGIEQNMIKDNYPKLKQYLLKLYERVGNLIKSIKDQPYLIKNCLYLLEKVDSIPGYKQQAQQLEVHLKELKEQFVTVDMRTILERLITILNPKKIYLPERPQERKHKMEEQKNNGQNQQSNKGNVSTEIKYSTTAKANQKNSQFNTPNNSRFNLNINLKETTNNMDENVTSNDLKNQGSNTISNHKVHNDSNGRENIQSLEKVEDKIDENSGRAKIQNERMMEEQKGRQVSLSKDKPKLEISQRMQSTHQYTTVKQARKEIFKEKMECKKQELPQRDKNSKAVEILQPTLRNQLAGLNSISQGPQQGVEKVQNVKDSSKKNISQKESSQKKPEQSNKASQMIQSQEQAIIQQVHAEVSPQIKMERSNVQVKKNKPDMQGIKYSTDNKMRDGEGMAKNKSPDPGKRKVEERWKDNTNNSREFKDRDSHKGHKEMYKKERRSPQKRRVEGKVKAMSKKQEKSSRRERSREKERDKDRKYEKYHPDSRQGYYRR